ncbi:MAG TPA: hypothetical protein VJT31_19870, partial [Rugosimonospora sp.]|nr:hypothetical protein [Rugosimonospora sp.]
LSFWPWHLAPVPVAGAASTGLVLVAAGLRRVPALPRPRGGDVVVLGFTAIAGASILWPFLGQDAAGRLGIVAPGGDLANHFALVDAVRAAGGYVFLRPGTAGAQLLWTGLHSYPQGAHLTTALLLNFLGTDTRPVPELGAFLWFEPGTFLLLCLCLLWAARRVAGPGTRALALLPVAALGTAYLVWSDPLMIMWNGFWPELLGLSEFALLAGVLVRPLHRAREQATVVAACLVAICFTYFLVLPVAAVLTGAWLLWYRRRVRRYTLGVLLGAALAGSVMIGISLAAYGPGQRLLETGSLYPIDMRILATFGLLAAGGIGLSLRRRSAAWRMTVLLPLTAGGLVLAVSGYQLLTAGTTLYYAYKAEHLAMVVFVVGLGPLARLVPVPRGRAAVLAPVLALAALVSLGPAGHFGLGRLYLDGTLSWGWVGRAALQVATRVPAAPGTVTVVWGGRPREYAAQTTQWTNVLWRTEAVAWRGHMWVSGEPLTGTLAAGDIVDFVRDSAPYRVRFVTDNPRLLATLGELRRERPDLPLDVVDLPLPR